MAYKISVTTRVSVTADTAEEVGEIYRQAAGGIPPRALPQASEACEVVPEEPQPPPLRLPTSENEQPQPDDEASPQEAPGESGEQGHHYSQDAQVSDLTLQEAINAYVASLLATGHSKGTIETYQTILRCLAKKLRQAGSIEAITAAELTHYLAGLRERTLSPAYISLCGRIVKGFFTWLVEAGEIKANPLAAMKPRTPPSNPVPPYSDDEIERLIGAAITPMERAAIILLVDTGMRASELAGLQRQDIDLEHGLLRVQGKGGKVRRLALNEQPRQVLEAYLASGGSQDGHLWPVGFNYQTLHYLVSQVGRRAGVPGVHPHRFRHTFASRFLAQTGNALALQALLGHSSLIMVQRYVAAAQADIALEAHREHSPLDALPNGF